MGDLGTAHGDGDEGTGYAVMTGMYLKQLIEKTGKNRGKEGGELSLYAHLTRHRKDSLSL